MKAVALFLVVVFVSCVCADNNIYDWYLQTPPNITAPKPLPRYHHAAAVIGGGSWRNNTNFTGSILVVGGFDFIGDGVFLNDTWVFHTSNNTWQFVNSSRWTNLTNRAYFTANSYGHEVVLFGGHAPNEGIYGEVWRFRGYSWHQDNFTNSTNPNVTAYIPREYHASAIINDTLYVFGGHSKFYGNTTNELLAYNLTSRNWTVVARNGGPGPLGRQGHTLHAWTDPALGDSLILFGGYSDQPYTGGFNDAWQYVLKDNKWYAFNNVNAPAGRSGHSGAIVGNTLFIQGGYAVQNITKPPTYDIYYGDTWSLTLNGNGASKWAQVTDDTAFGIGRRQGHQIVAVNNTLYSVAGYLQYVGLDASVWAFQDIN